MLDLSAYCVPHCLSEVFSVGLRRLIKDYTNGLAPPMSRIFAQFAARSAFASSLMCLLMSIFMRQGCHLHKYEREHRKHRGLHQSDENFKKQEWQRHYIGYQK